MNALGAISFRWLLVSTMAAYLGHGHAAHGYRLARALVASIGAPGALALNGVVVLVAAALLVIAAPAYRRPLARGADPS